MFAGWTGNQEGVGRVMGADASGTGQEPGQQSGQGPQGGERTGAPHTEPETFSRDYVAAIRRESASHRTALRAAEERVAALERERDEWKSKATGYEGELTTLRAERERAALERAIAETATGRDALYPDLVLAKIDPAKFERDKDGKPKNLDALVQEVRSAYPALFGARPGAAPYRPAGNPNGGEGSQGGRSAAGQSMNEFIRRAAGRL